MKDLSIIDSNELLQLRSYQECSNENEEEYKKNRGIIFDYENQIIVPSFGYTDMYTLMDMDKLNVILNPFNDWKFYLSVEGTLLRCYYYGQKWNLSTHRKLDAFQSRWSSRSTFGELFINGLQKIYHEITLSSLDEMFYSKLDKNKIYYFLLKSNSENRIVCQYIEDKSSILYIGAMIKNGDMFEYSTEIPSYLELFEKQQSITILSVDDLITHTEQLDPYQFQGILAWNTHSNKQIKILNSQYNSYYTIRANNPNLRFRFLELRNDNDTLRLLYQLYPKYSDIFDQYEDAIRQISRVLHQYYINRYIKNQYITLPREEYNVVKKVHQWHLLDKKKNMVFSQNVLDVLNKETPLSLYKMIKRYLFQKKVNHS
jgi:hypothetical protein